jgi:small subunit ribosomal protein S13
MARIKNIELPNEKHVSIGLTAIYGIGRSLALTICENAKVEPTKKIKDLTDAEIAALRKEIDNYDVEGDLRRDVQMSIKNKMEINCYQGIRHKKGLPVRGQRTSRNARTRKGKGKTVANKKKVGK